MFKMSSSSEHAMRVKNLRRFHNESQMSDARFFQKGTRICWHPYTGSGFYRPVLQIIQDVRAILN